MVCTWHRTVSFDFLLLFVCVCVCVTNIIYLLFNSLRFELWAVMSAVCSCIQGLFTFLAVLAATSTSPDADSSHLLRRHNTF